MKHVTPVIRTAGAAVTATQQQTNCNCLAILDYFSLFRSIHFLIHLPSKVCACLSVCLNGCLSQCPSLCIAVYYYCLNSFSILLHQMTDYFVGFYCVIVVLVVSFATTTKTHTHTYTQLKCSFSCLLLFVLFSIFSNILVVCVRVQQS